MKADDIFTREERQAYTEYRKLQKQGKLSDATDVMRHAVNKYNRIKESLNPLIYRYARAKKGAKERNIVWDISKEYFCKLAEQYVFCPVLGCELDYSRTPNVGGVNVANPCSASLDRIDSSLGYVEGNVWFVSWRANDLKKDGTLQEFKALVEALERLSHVPN